MALSFCARPRCAFSYFIFAVMIIGGIGLIRINDWRVSPLTPSGEMKDRRNKVLRKFYWLHRYSSPVLEVAMATFLFATTFFINRPIADITQISLGAAAGCSVLWLCFRRGNAMVTRVVFYAASILLMYGLLIGAENRPVFNLIVDGSLVTMLLVLFLAIRLTRKELFRLDTQDYLVFFTICVVPFLPFDNANDVDIGRITLRLSILLYSCEYLLSKNPKNNVLLKASAIACMVLLVLPN